MNVSSEPWGRKWPWILTRTAIIALCDLVLMSCVRPVSGPTPLPENQEFAEPVVREFETPAGDVTLHVRVAGGPEAGDVLIAINGGPGLSSRYMLSLEVLAGPEFAVVTYDQRGVGRSSAPPRDPARYALDRYIDDLEVVRKAIGAERVHLLGNSWGGIISMRYASVHPEQVRTILLVGSGPPTWTDLLVGMTRFNERLAALQAQGIIPRESVRQEGQDDPALKAYFSDPDFWFSPDDKGGPPEFSEVASQMTWAAVQGYDLTDEISRLTHDVLVIWGEDDPFGVPMAEATVAALPSAKVEYVLLHDCGHFWHECPEQFFPRVRAFLGLDVPP